MIAMSVRALRSRLCVGVVAVGAAVVATAPGCSSDKSFGGGTGGSTGAGGASSGPVTVAASCPFTACGGTLESTSWGYTGACINETSLLGSLRAACPALSLTGVTGTVSGTLAFAGGQVTQQGSLTLTATLNVPGGCAAPLGGCVAVGTALALQMPGTTCTGVDTCRCIMSTNETLSRGDAYTASGNSVTTGGESYVYCLSGSTLAYRTTTATDPEITYQTARR
jgi:hypothetical protein